MCTTELYMMDTWSAETFGSHSKKASHPRHFELSEAVSKAQRYRALGLVRGV